MIFEQIRVDGDRNFAYVIGDEGTEKARSWTPRTRRSVRLIERSIMG